MRGITITSLHNSQARIGAVTNEGCENPETNKSHFVTVAIYAGEILMGLNVQVRVCLSM